eukprot:11327364-Alexandrium_andersonii.AAC.1
MAVANFVPHPSPRRRRCYLARWDKRPSPPPRVHQNSEHASHINADRGAGGAREVRRLRRLALESAGVVSSADFEP